MPLSVELFHLTCISHKWWRPLEGRGKTMFSRCDQSTVALWCISMLEHNCAYTVRKLLCLNSFFYFLIVLWFRPLLGRKILLFRMYLCQKVNFEKKKTWSLLPFAVVGQCMCDTFLCIACVYSSELFAESLLHQFLMLAQLCCLFIVSFAL